EAVDQLAERVGERRVVLVDGERDHRLLGGDGHAVVLLGRLHDEAGVLVGDGRDGVPVEGRLDPTVEEVLLHLGGARVGLELVAEDAGHVGLPREARAGADRADALQARDGVDAVLGDDAHGVVEGGAGEADLLGAGRRDVPAARDHVGLLLLADHRDAVGVGDRHERQGEALGLGELAHDVDLEAGRVGALGLRVGQVLRHAHREGARREGRQPFVRGGAVGGDGGRGGGGAGAAGEQHGDGGDGHERGGGAGAGGHRLELVRGRRVGAQRRPGGRDRPAADRRPTAASDPRHLRGPRRVRLAQPRAHPRPDRHPDALDPAADPVRGAVVARRSAARVAAGA
ncbi:hypothetical protein FF38_02918, partial [Lucilia cuprina]